MNKTEKTTTKTPFVELPENKLPRNSIKGFNKLKKYIQKVLPEQARLLYSRLHEGQVIKGRTISPELTLKAAKELPEFRSMFKCL